MSINCSISIWDTLVDMFVLSMTYYVKGACRTNTHNL